MPGRSPHRRSPPPPPLISRHSPPRGRIRSPDRHHMEIVSSSRGRDRREFRPVRRSRSPPLKRRSYSPPLKRKASPSSRERELTRRTKISKSPVGSRVGSDHVPYIASATDPDIRPVRSSSGSERFRTRAYEGERPQALPQFRGPERSIDFDINELKKFTVEIVRKTPNGGGDETLNRSIINPDDIAPVRRPDEGARPLFMRVEQTAGSSKDRSHAGPSDDYRRIVAIDTSRTGHERGHSHERTRYSPGYYESQRRSYYSERPHSPYESHHRSPSRHEYVEPREKVHERRASSREDLRRDLDGRRREERRYSPERRSYEREGDLRTRINEKRSEPHPRAEEREHSSRRYESERERHSSRTHHSPPRERKRGGSLDRHESSRPSRGETWEKDGDRRRRPHSREREDRGRERYEHSAHYVESDKSRRSQPYKTEFEPKKYYKTYEEKEFIPPPIRGRGLPIRRGLPPVMRGRGIIRGMPRVFRGGMMGPMIRGIPRGPFMGMRGFPPRFFPPY